MGGASGNRGRGGNVARLSAVDRRRHRPFAREPARPGRPRRGRGLRPRLVDGAAALPWLLGAVDGAGLRVLFLQALPAALGRRFRPRHRRGSGRLHAAAARCVRTHRRDRQHPPRDHRRLRARPAGQVGRQGVARRRRGDAQRTPLRLVAAAVGHDRALRLRPDQLFRRHSAGDDCRDDGYLSGAADPGAAVPRRDGDGSGRSRLAGDDPVFPADAQDSTAAPPLLAPLLPAIALFYMAATVFSAVQFWRGRGGAWKGRYQAASG